MKTIQEMWREYWKGHPDQHNCTNEEYEFRRQIFFAGFNRCYNVAQSLNGSSDVNDFCIPQYESEMDAHSEET